MKTQIDKYKQFMLESNRIENEDRINPSDIKAVEFALKGINKLSDILELHRLLGEYLNKDWVGKFRTCDVRVGSYAPPSYYIVPDLMQKYWNRFDWMDSWEAHTEFERIHPFRDLNGRTGRLIWLSKAIKGEYDFSISFLQAYYYQTLQRYERRLK